MRAPAASTDIAASIKVNLESGDAVCYVEHELSDGCHESAFFT